MTVTLKVNGLNWTDWESVTVKRGLKTVCSGAQFETPGELVPAILPFMPCTISDDADLLLTGYVMKVGINVAARATKTTITAKSKTVQLVHCKPLGLFPTTQFNGNTLDAIARAICAKLGITVVIGAGVVIGDAFPDATFGDETAFAYLERLARQRAVMLTDDANGDLVITTAGTARAPASLVMGGDNANVHEASGALDGEQRFSIYRILSQAGIAQTGSEPLTSVEGQFADPGVPLFRPWAKIAESALLPGDAQKRAAWEAAHRLGEATKATLTVPEWRAGGVLWPMNVVAKCQVPRLGINGDLLIADVAYVFDHAGKRVQLGVAPPSAYAPEPAVPPTSGGWGQIINVTGPNATQPL
jgi:prophage tail gpP-like protein